ncbi:hypothetical protein H9L39_18421 [Fusarium oxysporum f. sp. albedinis]|nr:hypothetical protein H9L39_18421 [Fusarium oxysporum f. sp. albedinis]
MFHAIFSAQCQPIRIWTADEDTFRSQSECFNYVSATFDATVEKDVKIILHSVDYPREHPKAADSAVLLPSAVIADHDPLNANFNALPGILNTLDTLEHNRPIPMHF